MPLPKLVAPILIALSLNACGSTGSGGSGGVGAAGAGGSAGSGQARATGGAGGADAGNGGTTGVGGVGGGVGGAAGGGGPGAANGTCGDSTGPSSGDGCNTLAMASVCVQEMVGTGNAPTANGGVIMAGTYELMTKKVYGPTDAAVTLSAERNTIMISSVTPVSFVLDTLDQSGAQVRRSHGAVTISGATVTFTPTCPPPADGGDQGGTVGFTANGANLTIIESSNDGTVVSVYIKH